MAIKRQDIIDRLKTKLGTILSANGYHSEAGAHIYVFKPTKWAAEELPGINIRDPKDAIDGETNTAFDEHELHIELEFVATPGLTSDQEARKIIADIYKAIGVFDAEQQAAHLIEGVVLTADDGDSLELTSDERVVSGGFIDFKVKFRTTRFQES